MIFLGLASNYHARDIWRHSFAHGNKKDYVTLEAELAKRYGSDLARTSLIFSGRSAIALALKSFLASGKLQKGDHVAINAFTCYAVVQAVRHAGLEPVFVDLEQAVNGEILPNYSAKALDALAQKDKKLKVFILQNTFGFPVDIRQFDQVLRSHDLLLLEDLAHCTGRKYPDGREIGTVGDATCLSFGKGKSLDTITGGAVILRGKDIAFPKSFDKATLKSRELAGGPASRASWYPFFAAIARGLSHLRLEKPWLGFLLKVHAIERSGDTPLKLDSTVSRWQAKLALYQLKNLKNSPLREFFLVDNRAQCLKELRKHGAHLEEFWYETPVAPARYYHKAGFSEQACPNAVFFADHVVNLPTWYSSKRRQKEVATAKQLIKSHALKGGKK